MTYEDIAEYHDILNELIHGNNRAIGKLAQRGDTALLLFDNAMEQTLPEDDTAEIFAGLTREQMVCCQHVLDLALYGDPDTSRSTVTRLGNEALGFLKKAMRAHPEFQQGNSNEGRALHHPAHQSQGHRAA